MSISAWGYSLVIFFILFCIISVLFYFSNKIKNKSLKVLLLSFIIIFCLISGFVYSFIIQFACIGNYSDICYRETERQMSLGFYLITFPLLFLIRKYLKISFLLLSLAYLLLVWLLGMYHLLDWFIHSFYT